MSESIAFTKMVASGNDFVVIDNRRRELKIDAAWVQRICRPHTGVGADGVLIFEPSPKTSFRMSIFNPDGSKAEACGNGFRCVARFAKEKLGLPSRFEFESDAGLIGASVKGEEIAVDLVAPSAYQESAEIEVMDRRLHYSFIHTGVPHAVIFVEGLAKIEVQELGRAIRRHERFHPRGTNVNFVEVKGRHELHVRTYERGVEKETLACGTGSAAAAVVSALRGYVTPPVEVTTSGGEILGVDFQMKDGAVAGLSLAGKAHFVFEGRWLNGS